MRPSHCKEAPACVGGPGAGGFSVLSPSFDLERFTLNCQDMRLSCADSITPGPEPSTGLFDASHMFASLQLSVESVKSWFLYSTLII